MFPSEKFNKNIFLLKFDFHLARQNFASYETGVDLIKKFLVGEYKTHLKDPFSKLHFED